MPNLYPVIDAHAGWGLLVVCVLALVLRVAQQVREPRGALALPAAPGAAVSLVVAVAALAAFAALAQQVMAATPPAWVTAMDGWAASHRAAIPVGAMGALVVITQLGDVSLLSGLAALVALALAWRGRWAATAWWLLAVAGNGLLVRWAKQVFGRARPDTPYLEVHGYSFPSGHAMSAMVIYGLLCVVLWGWGRGPARTRGFEEPNPATRRLAQGLVLLIVAVGLSRVWLQVHYASDVLAGWLLGLAWLAVLSLLARAGR